MKDDNKLELDFSKSIPKKNDTRKPYNINEEMNSKVENYYKENKKNNNYYKKNKIDPKEQERMLREGREIQRKDLVLRLFISSLIIWTYYLLIYKYMYPIHGAKVMFYASIGLFVYTFIAYFIRPKPDMNNLGYFGGLINRPFDYSDDWNRFLLNLKFLLLPGVIISEAIVDLFNRD